jgi:hypothetical protein
MWGNASQVLSKEDTKNLNWCKTMMEKVFPLMVVFDPVEGFIVEADKSIIFRRYRLFKESGI